MPSAVAEMISAEVSRPVSSPSAMLAGVRLASSAGVGVVFVVGARATAGRAHALWEALSDGKVAASRLAA